LLYLDARLHLNLEALIAPGGQREPHAVLSAPEHLEPDGPIRAQEYPLDRRIVAREIESVFDESLDGKRRWRLAAEAQPSGSTCW